MAGNSNIFYIFIIFNLLISSIFPFSFDNIKIERLSIEQGLSQSSVYGVTQDSMGFMWFGTTDGLNRFDGYQFKMYRFQPWTPGSLSSNRIYCLYKDTQGVQWIGTAGGGLNCYDPGKNQFKHFLIKPGNGSGPSRNYVTKIYEDHFGKLWVGTRGNGLYTFDRKTEQFETPIWVLSDKEDSHQTMISDIIEAGNHLWIGSEDAGLKIVDYKQKWSVQATEEELVRSEIKSTFITTLLGDGDSIVWIGTFDSGLYKYNLTSHSFTPFPGRDKLTKKIITCLLKDHKGLLWVGTNSGLISIDESSGSFMNFVYDPADVNSISYNLIVTIYEDQSGVLWIGTDGGGVSKITSEGSVFEVLNPTKARRKGLRSSLVNTIAEDTRENLWLGTDNGVYICNPNKNTIHDYFVIPGSDKYPGIMEIILDKTGDPWIGSYKYGLISPRVPLENMHSFPVPLTEKYFRIYRNIAGISSRLSSNMILSLYFDRSGILWIGTDGGGLNKLVDTATGEFVHYQHNPNDSNTISDNDVWAIYESPSEKDSILWIGTASGGLNKFNRKSGRFEHFMYNPNDPTSISANRVYVIHESRDGTFWIGTDAGLNKFNRSTETFEYYGTNVGFPNTVIYGILEANNEDLWLSTNNGLVRFNPHSLEVKNFTIEDGLPSNEFNARAFFENEEGEFFFGCLKGLVYFYPEKMNELQQSYIPPLVLTEFRLFNKIIDLDSNFLPQTITTAKELKLKHNQNTISFEFASLDFAKPAKNRYAYRLEGFEDHWNFTDASLRTAHYTKLTPGDYTLQIKGTNHDGVWNGEGISLKISILPPWWETWWAYIIYFTLALGTLYGIRRYELSRQRLKHSMELEHVETEKIKELDRIKSRFLANISHEFRTPLTLIRGPIQQLLSGKFRGNKREQYSMILHNTRRLLNLINQLLDLSRIESGKLKLHARPEDIVGLSRQITMSFESLARIKNIDLKFSGPMEPLIVYLDRRQFEKILINLVMNALKFTPGRGRVQVYIPSLKTEIKKGMVEICVRDTGQGIPSEHLPHIFDRFYQAGDNNTQDSTGSGIGLALVKELVELHYGKLEVSSEAGRGTEFTIRLPLGMEHLAPEEILPPIKENLKMDVTIYPEEFTEEKTEKILFHKSPFPRDANIVLIVEDNGEMRLYIRELLVSSYRILEAVNCSDGFVKASETIPDIIISDVMMPGMDGFQFCEKIKTDERTSHIPVILLTAKSSGESKLRGLETGADDYLIKPFDASELKARVKNLIEQRQKLRERFRQEISLEPQKIAITSADAKFIRKVVYAVELNMGSDFGVWELADEVGMSRSQLHRKLRGLTDQTPVDFIRTIRLKRAAALLKHQSGNISEIAYQVGFSNPAYFAECFRKLFGVSPKKYNSQFKS